MRALSDRFSALALNILRSAAAGALLAAYVGASEGPRALVDISPRAFLFLSVSILIAVGVGDTAFFESTKALGLARAMTISTTYPLMAAALAVWWPGEPLELGQGIGIVVTISGLAIIVSERAPATRDTEGVAPSSLTNTGAAAPSRKSRAGAGIRSRHRGITLALLAAAGWAVSALMLKVPMQEVDAVTSQAIRLPVAAVVLWMTPWARGTVGSLRRHGRQTTWLLLALTVATVASAVLFAAGLKYADVGVATVLSATSPLFALPIGRVAFGEAVTWRAVAGAVLAVLGIALVSL